MSKAMPLDQQMPERLTWQQICERYPEEWVVLVDTEWINDTDSEFGTTSVLGHFKSRKAASPFIKAAFQHHREVGSFWTGELRGTIPRFTLP